MMVLTSRDRRRGEAAALGLSGRGLDVQAQPLDVVSSASVERFASWVREHLGHVDLLVNNAAIDYETDQRATAADLARVERAWQTNTPGAWRVTLALLRLLRAGTHARIVNVSSAAGSISEIGAGTPGLPRHQSRAQRPHSHARRRSRASTIPKSGCPWLFAERWFALVRRCAS
jgi:NAD(P)-dependent dehydrogenase (short-subunit alcohol dehydrogenase family)